MITCNCGREFESRRSLNSHARFCDEYVKITPECLNYKISDNLYKCKCGKEFDNNFSLAAHTSHCTIHNKDIVKRPHEISGKMNGWEKLTDKERRAIHQKAGLTLKKKYASGN